MTRAPRIAIVPWISLTAVLGSSSACATPRATTRVESPPPSAPPTAAPTPSEPEDETLLRACLAGTYPSCVELEALCADSDSKLCPLNIVDPHDETSMRMGIISGFSKTSQLCNMYGDGGLTAAIVCSEGDRGTAVRVMQALCKANSGFLVMHFVSPTDQATASLDPSSCWVRFE